MGKVSENEWLILNALWESGGAELGALWDALRPATGWSRNTLHTYLTRMEAKGLVAIDKNRYPHIYRPTQTRESTQAQARRGFLERVYQGAVGEMVAAFLKEEPLTAEDRDKLRRLLDEMEV